MPIFLFTDIEKSTQKWEKYQADMNRILLRHDEILKKHLGQCGGRIIKHTGDGIFAVFENGQPLACALAIQKDFQNENWAPLDGLRIRMALHAGHAERRDDDYFGPEVNRTARVLDTGWGGQILLTPSVATAQPLPEGASLTDMGPHMLKDLSQPQHIYCLTHPDLKLRNFPPLRSLTGRAQNLPYQATHFIGREDELARVAALLNDPSCRLVTLTGIGGVGKTRLALQAAANLIEQYKDGVFYVPLDSKSTADQAVGAIAASVKGPGVRRDLIAYLKDKNLLLILDSFEQLTRDAELITELLAETIRLRIIATSREKLSIQGEWVLDVQGLRVPVSSTDRPEDSDAVRLFIEIARMADVDFKLTSKEAVPVTRLCQLLEGLPLGIEFAASKTGMLSCEEIFRETEKNMDFLDASFVNLPERQRNLRNVFEYTWQRLNTAQRDSLCRVAVFRKIFTREAAEKVSGVKLDELTALVARSVLRRNLKGRFELPEVYRKYALEKLEQSPSERGRLQESFCAYYCELLSTASISVIEEMDNVKEAWLSAIAGGKDETVEQLMDALYEYFNQHGMYREGEELFRTSIQRWDTRHGNASAQSVQSQVLRAELVSRQASFYLPLLPISKAGDLLQQALNVFRQAGIRSKAVFTLNHLSLFHGAEGNFVAAEQYLHDALKIVRDPEGSRETEAWAYLGLAGVAFFWGKYSEAERYIEEGIDLLKKSGARGGSLLGLILKGELFMVRGEYEGAGQLFDEAVSVARDTHSRALMGRALRDCAELACIQGEYEEARRLARESLTRCKETGDRMGEGLSLDRLGYAAFLDGDYDEGKKLLDEAMSLLRYSGNQQALAWCLYHMGCGYLLSGNADTAKQFLRESYDLFEKISCKLGRALSESRLGEVVIVSGQYLEYKGYFYDALKTAWEIKSMPAVLDSLSGMAMLLVKEANMNGALEFLIYAINHPAASQESRDRLVALHDGLKAKLLPTAYNVLLEKTKKGRLEEAIEDMIKKRIF